MLSVSCSEERNKDHSLTANHSGAATRAHWQAERKPVVIETDTVFAESIGVSMLLRDATNDEFNALASSRFTLKDGLYHANDYSAQTSDSTAVTGICFPLFRGAGMTSSIELRAPYGENLYGVETERSFGNEIRIRYVWRSSMALLRIFTESDDVRDYLDRLTIVGDHIYDSGLYYPYRGEWRQSVSENGIDAPAADCLLNNGRNHDFFLIPTDTSGVVTIKAVINGHERLLRKTIPPMSAGSLTELHLKATNRNLVVSSSWVDGRRKLFLQDRKNMVNDSIKVGHFLQSNGDIVRTRNGNTIAVVCEVQSNGKHGKAVALEDCRERYVFSNKELPGGRDFATIDGVRQEGVLNPSRSAGIADDNRVIWTPKAQYNEKCALGYTDGAGLSHSILLRSNTVDGGARVLAHSSMIEEAQRHPGSYIPSLGELVRLYFLVKQKKVELPELTPLEGEYLTSNEKGNHYYMIDFSSGIITSSLSKQYGAAQLRLFYLF